MTATERVDAEIEAERVALREAERAAQTARGRLVDLESRAFDMVRASRRAIRGRCVMPADARTEVEVRRLAEMKKQRESESM